MKKIVFSAVALLMSVSAMAGGLLTNTNANAAYVRQMSQEGIIDITGMYANPAGTAFLSNGWHLALHNQSAHQVRSIETQFPLFAYNVNDRTADRTVKGTAMAPAVPSLSLSYNKDKWSVGAHFGLIGGGGKCEFENGLSSFEALYAGQLLANSATIIGMANAGVGAGVAALGLPGPDYKYAGYSMDSYMKGRNYYFGLQLGATYKFTDNFAGYLGVRGIYGTCNYNGYVQDVRAHLVAQTAAYSAVPQLAPFATYAADPQSDLTLNANQTGFGITPIIGFDWKVNKHWNLAAKFEAPTKMSLKNSSEMNAMAQAQAADPTSPLAQFADGQKVRNDIPGLLAVGVQYSPIEKVRIMASFHEFMDKTCKQYNSTNTDHNTWEVIGGVEVDACKLITVSASVQHTEYGISDAGMNDLSFNNSNTMIGAGLRFNCSKRCTVDLGYMHTFYKDREVVTATAAGPKSDKYSRKNDVVGIGVNLAF